VPVDPLMDPPSSAARPKIGSVDPPCGPASEPIGVWESSDIASTLASPYCRASSTGAAPSWRRMTRP
jgi:hypothetical protein